MFKIGAWLCDNFFFNFGVYLLFPGDVLVVESFLVLVLFRRSPPLCRLACITCGQTGVRAVPQGPGPRARASARCRRGGDCTYTYLGADSRPGGARLAREERLVPGHTFTFTFTKYKADQQVLLQAPPDEPRSATHLLFARAAGAAAWVLACSLEPEDSSDEAADEEAEDWREHKQS